MIRPALPNKNDISQLMALCKMANASAPNYQLKINKRKVQHTLLAAMDDRKSFLYVAEKDGAIIGFMLAQIDTLWCSDDESATDLMFYVKPSQQYNTAFAAKALLKTFDTWWRKFPKCREAVLANSSGRDDNQQTSRLYSVLGYISDGAIHTKLRKHL